MVDGETMSLYGLLNKFKELAPKNITRFKGLGEMNEDQLYDTVIGKDKERFSNNTQWMISSMRSLRFVKLNLVRWILLRA